MRVGDRVTRATELTTIDDNQALEVYLPVPVQQAPDLSLGLPVRLVNDTLGEVNLPRPALLQQEGYRPHDLLWQDADESYSVYDHPMPLVFRRTRSLDAQTLTRLLTEAP